MDLPNSQHRSCMAAEKSRTAEALDYHFSSPMPRCSPAGHPLAKKKDLSVNAALLSQCHRGSLPLPQAAHEIPINSAAPSTAGGILDKPLPVSLRHVAEKVLSCTKSSLRHVSFILNIENSLPEILYLNCHLILRRMGTIIHLEKINLLP